MKSKKESNVSVQTVATLNHVAWRGPIPPPEVMQAYNKLVPNSAERILKMAEDNSRHKIELEKRQQDDKYKTVTLGQHYALIFILVFFATAIIGLFLGYPFTSGVIGSVGIASIVSALITDRVANKSSK